MRIRKVIAATLLAGGALFLWPTVASAQEQPTETTVKLPEAQLAPVDVLERNLYAPSPKGV